MNSLTPGKSATQDEEILRCMKFTQKHRYSEVFSDDKFKGWKLENIFKEYVHFFSLNGKLVRKNTSISSILR